MSGQSDPALKALVETSPADWLPVLGRRRARVTVEDADIATVVSGAGDKVLRVHARPPYLLHFDFQSGHDSARLPKRLLWQAAGRCRWRRCWRAGSAPCRWRRSAR
jgi:hypothetical protein